MYKMYKKFYLIIVSIMVLSLFTVNCKKSGGSGGPTTPQTQNPVSASEMTAFLKTVGTSGKVQVVDNSGSSPTTKAEFDFSTISSPNATVEYSADSAEVNIPDAISAIDAFKNKSAVGGVSVKSISYDYDNTSATITDLKATIVFQKSGSSDANATVTFKLGGSGASWKEVEITSDTLKTEINAQFKDVVKINDTYTITDEFTYEVATYRFKVSPQSQSIGAGSLNLLNADNSTINEAFKKVQNTLSYIDFNPKTLSFSVSAQSSVTVYSQTITLTPAKGYKLKDSTFGGSGNNEFAIGIALPEIDTSKWE